MMINKEQKRKKAIKQRYVLFATKCHICNNYYIRERMWKFSRYGVNNEPVKFYYCQNCVKTVNQALEKIDAEEWHLGGLVGDIDYD